jgi:hypothetical protein
MRSKIRRSFVASAGAMIMLSVSFVYAAPAMAAYEFAWWMITPASVSSPDGHIRSVRSSIKNYDDGQSVNPGGSENFYLNRVDMEYYNGNYGGLIQVGMGITTSDLSLGSSGGACGSKVNVHDFVEYRPILTLDDNSGYTCFWGATAFQGSQKRYSVGKVADSGTCDGCHEAHVNGVTTDAGKVSLATSHGDATNADFALASAEVFQDDSTQHGRFQYWLHGRR